MRDTFFKKSFSQTLFKKLFSYITAVVFCFLLPNFAQAGSAGKNLSKALYYHTLLEFTSTLQIDYYREFSAYLEQTKAKDKPLLIPYFMGLSYYEKGEYQQAAQLFKEASDSLVGFGLPPSIQDYKYYSKVMLAASHYRLGKTGQLKELVTKRTGQDQNCFLGYILLRVDYRTDLAKDLLSNCPNDYFDEVIYKWTRYKLGILVLKDLRIAQYKLKQPELLETYDKIKLNKNTIPLNMKYYNPAQIGILKEIHLYKALESLDSKNMEDYTALGQTYYLLGNYEKAIGYLEDYTRAFPLNLYASILLGQCYWGADDPKKADQVWDWVEKSGGSSVIRKLTLVLSKEKGQDSLDLLYETRDKEIGEKKRFDAGFYRKHKNYYRTLGLVYLNLHKYKDAAANLMLTYERSRRELPRTYDQTYLICLGYSLAKAGRLKESIDFALKGAASLNPAAYQAFHAVNYGLYMLKHE